MPDSVGRNAVNPCVWGVVLRHVVAMILCLIAVEGRAESPITAVALSLDRKSVVLGSQEGIRLRDWPTVSNPGPPMDSLPTDLPQVHDLCFSPDGQFLLVAGGTAGESGGVELIDWRLRKRLNSIALGPDVVYRVAWSPDGKAWAAAGADGVCTTFHSASSQRLVLYKDHSRPVLTIAWLPDGKSIVSAGVDQTLRLWDSTTGVPRRTLDNHVGPVNHVAVRPKSGDDTPPTVASVSEDRTVRLWQPTIGRLVRFARLASIPRTVAWSPKGDRIFVGCSDGGVRILNPETMEIAETLEGLKGRIHEIAVDGEAGMLLIAGEQGMRAIKLSTE